MQREYPLMRFSSTERLWMEWLRELPQVTVYGDPMGGGGTRMADMGDDWYNRMLIFSRKYNPRRDEHGRGKPLVVVKNWRNEAREHQMRHNALTTWLGRLEFSNTIGARRFLNAVARSKYEVTNFARTSEQVQPRHDELSHPRTALEYIAVNIDSIRRSRRAKGERVALERPEVSLIRDGGHAREERTIDPYEGIDLDKISKVA
jgi:hypothetical protein